MLFRIFLLFFSIFHTTSGCPAGWYGFGNSCYLFRVRSLHLRGLNWDNARSYCLSFGGDLVSVSNKSEMDFIYSKSSTARNEHYWIGLNDRRNESFFVWSDGTPYNRSVYSNWYQNEPNDRAGEDCVELFGRRWNDDHCKKEYSYICERLQGAPMPTFKTVSPPPTSAPIACPAGWVFYGSSCYLFSNLRKKWIDAKTDCRATGGHLLKIDDATEQHFISIMQILDQHARWMGLNDMAAEGVYRWESDNSVVNYTYWGTEEPNDYAGVEDCVTVSGGSSAGFWNDDYCDSEHHYICEKPGGRNLCPVNWRTFGDFCYKFNVHTALFKDWPDAERACLSYGTSTELISVNSEAEQAYILRALRDMRVSSQVWLGLNDRKVEGRYEWSDKSPVTYRNWAPRQPPSGFLAGFSDCSVIVTNTQNGTWSASFCFFRLGYICKRKIGVDQCDSPFGMEDGNIGDNQITASSSFNVTSRAGQARLRLKSGNSTAGAWCAAQNNVGEYLQIDLGVVRQVQHIALQGRPGSSDFVRRFYLKYGDNGLDFNSYGENATINYEILTGNSDAKTVRNIVLSEPINARFIRIYPLTWNSRICLRTEIYGCASQASSKKCGVGWEVGLDGTCYQINSNQWKIWTDARATCLSRGGDLVSILSVREKNWLNNRLNALSGWAYSFWIGLNDRDLHKHFYWSDGSPYRLTAWDSGYPKDYTLQNLRACVEIDAAKGAWRDASCGEYKPFICKRKMAGTDGVKFPVTGNWISGTDYYWPLDTLVNGKALGTVPATVHGNVTASDRVQNGRDTLSFANFPAYLDVGQFQVQCITDPSQCGNGITVSFVVQFNDGAKSWTRNTFVLDTIGDETLLRGNRGFAVYVVNRRVYVTVVTRTKKWTVSQPLVTGTRAWGHVMFTWQLEKGLVLYINGTKSTSLRYGVNIQSGTRSLTLTVGSKTAQPSAGGFYMRSLAVWKRFFSVQEVNNIYLAEFGSCRTGWKDFGQFCYQFNLNKKSWRNARVACVRQRAELVSIHSPVEQSHITLEVGPYGLQAEAWIGLHDQGVESEFVWSDGSPVAYTNWDDWNPDDWSSSEDCANVRSYNDGRWNDQNCRNSLPYICKKPKEYIAPGGIAPTSAPQTLYVCELTSTVLSCPSSTVLSITTAYWGRTDAHKCGAGSLILSNCWLDVTSDIRKRCQGLNHCSLRASNSFGSDPCPGVSKYLEISYVCKRERSVIPSCHGEWHRTPDGSRCFRVLFGRKNWQDARSACRWLGAELISFHSSMDNIVLMSLLVNSWDIGDVEGIWIGLTDTGQKGVYNWTDGSAVDYSSWLNGQPDERDLSGSCVSATLLPGKMSWLFWQDVDCARELPYACAKDPNNYHPPTSLPTRASNDTCPSGWTLNGSSCYKMMPQSKTWTAARDTCRAFSQNSDLASIHSLAENTVVANLFNGSAFAAWIGLSDRGVLYGYVWSDRSPVDFTRWNPQQPDSHHGQQPCVEMYSTGEWGDTGCYSVKQFICKMPRADNGPTRARPTTTPAVTTTQAPDICPPGWILWNTMCYFFSDGSNSSVLTWYEARQACQRVRGGDLVSILTAAENDFVKLKIQRNRYDVIWIGLNDLGTEASFRWSDGSPVSYTNYGNNQPDDEYGQEDCLEINRLGMWSDQHCSSTRPYICKKTNNTIIPAFTMVPPSPGPKLGRCNEGWINFDKSCYLFVSDSPQTWENARNLCRQGLNTSTKGDLVTVDDPYEQAFLTTMLFEKQEDFWIGFSDRRREGWFWWTDNSPVKYTNWDANQPVHSSSRFDCVHMIYFKNHEGRWITAQCDQTQGYICETRALPLGPTTAASPSNGSCPVHYQLFGGDCFFVSYVKLSWQEAREACRGESNGDLMSVHTPTEQAFVVRSLKNFDSGLWLGFVREANSAEFGWSDNSLPLYTTWAAREPNGLSTRKSCVVANNSHAGLWSDEECSQRNGFVCRIIRGEPHVSPPVLGNCPAGWEKFDKNCYQFRRDRLSWTAARATCQRQGGNLVSITSRHEQDYIAYHYRGQYYSNIWTGLNDRALEAGYSWSDGSPVSFLNWLPGEPNDDSSIENCVEMSAGSFLWKDNMCTVFNSYICKQPLECAGDLGMVSGRIKGNQVTASSSASPLYRPGMARLNSSTAWCAGNDNPDQFIQVDLLTETRLSKISTQGFSRNGAISYVNLFKLQTSEDGVNFHTYQKNGKDWIFVANRDANSVVTSAVEPSIDTRLIRLVPVSWKSSICLRIELYGCPFACETPLGIQSGAVKDGSISASSSSDNLHRITNVRPTNSVGWCAKASDTQPWLQISFPNLDTKITKITTWGGGKESGFVTVYRLMFTDVADVNTWAVYNEGGKIRNFRGNQDAVNPVTHLLADPIITRNLRVKPQSWSAGGACLRLELFGCEDGCDTALGLGQGIVEDTALSASSSLNHAHAASEGRLNGRTGWCAADDDKKPFFIVDLGTIMKISKASTQGARDGEGFIKSYTVSTRDGVSLPWRPLLQSGETKVFLANIDNSSVVSNIFASSTLRGRYFKIVPISWNIRPCLRLELFGCKTNVQPTPFPSNIPPSGRTVYSGSLKLSKEEWIDDYKNSKSAAFKALAEKVEKAITEVYSGEDKASLAFSKVKVTGFRRGSVVVFFNLMFIRDIANELGGNVTRNLVSAVRTGSLRGLAVDPDSLNITLSDTGDQGTAAALTGGKSGGLSRGAVAGITVAAMILFAICGGAGGWWLYKRRKGKRLFQHQEFNNPVYFSSDKQEVKSENGAISSKPTLKFEEEYKG